MPVVKTFRTIERSDNWSVIFCQPVKLVYYTFPIGIISSPLTARLVLAIESVCKN